ncbi:MAG: NADH-quinone oxidoreductase subunit C [Bacteroidetes bacterium]|nr:NADH-quinone oxidoreductase subunit C [Bacteroidota bacterium]
MSWLEIRNLQSVALGELPVHPIEELRQQVLDRIVKGNRLVQLFGDRSARGISVYAVLADDDSSRLYVASSVLQGEKSFTSMTPDVPAAHLFERELHEEFGVEPAGHPWLKPLRKGIPGIDPAEDQYKFFGMKGEEVHEVGVGPIHAGVIEPGHFRFSCHGEKVYQLEIKLGFQHRGVQELFVKNGGRPIYLEKLAESVAGDTVIGHAGGFIRAFESLAGTVVPRRAKVIRTVALELERIAVHLGDLSALSGDVAYLTGNSVFGALRTKVINTTMAICGNRFGRGLMKLGGVNFDITTSLHDQILSTIDKLEDDVALASEVLFSSASVLERFEKTGVVSKETATAIGMVGPSARASGVPIDVRSDHPFGGFEFLPVHKLTLPGGDVFARAYIRFIEIQQSIKIIREQLGGLAEGPIRQTTGLLAADRMVVSLTEGWRGEIAYILITGSDAKIRKVKIKDPSFNNWLALSLAVRGEGISDFPLCNKSFDLSYCGFDL